MQISRLLFHPIWILSAIPSVVSLPLMWPEVLDAMRATPNKMEEFIKHLGIPSIKFCHADEEDDGLPPMFNKDLDFGDLLLDKKDDENDIEDNDEEHDFISDSATALEPAIGEGSALEPAIGEGSANIKRKWESGIVPYYISNDYSADQRQTIEQAISGMNSRLSNVQLRPFNQLTDKNYVLIFSGKGCFSKLGMRGGQQPVSLQTGKCLTNGIVQHELTHALGFSHEHNRPDRNRHILILPDNIPKDWLKDYERNSPQEAAYVGRYDFYSAMHYPPQAPGGEEDKLAFDVLDSSVDIQKIGNKEELSDLDVQKIDEFYDVSDS